MCNNNKLDSACTEFIFSLWICLKKKIGEIKKFTTSDEVREDWIDGKISEIDLKEAVIQRINELVLPTRRHFEENEKAKKLLETIQQYKREEEDTRKTKKKSACMKLALEDHGKGGFIGDGVNVVFAPQPHHTTTILHAKEHTFFF